MTGHPEEFLFIICPQVVSLQRCSYLETSTWGDSKVPFSISITPLPTFLAYVLSSVLRPIQGPPPSELAKAYLALQVTERISWVWEWGNRVGGTVVCVAFLWCVLRGVGAGESDLMCRILFITRSFLKLCPSTSCTVIRP